jgi:S1-C subfamily serine protease
LGVPVDVARAVADDLVLLGHVRTVWLGVRGETLGSGAGVTIAALMDGSPAGAAGLLAGDIVRRVDGRPVGSMAAVRVTLRRRHPGEHVMVVYDRKGKRRTADLVLAERPPA